MIDDDTPDLDSGGSVLVEILSLLAVMLGVAIAIHITAMALYYGP
ncbi:MAG: hypothetical protein U0797_22675 [Gemmataceae bacterium]